VPSIDGGWITGYNGGVSRETAGALFRKAVVYTWCTRLCKWVMSTLSHSKQMKRGVYEQGRKN